MTVNFSDGSDSHITEIIKKISPISSKDKEGVETIRTILSEISDQPYYRKQTVRNKVEHDKDMINDLYEEHTS